MPVKIFLGQILIKSGTLHLPQIEGKRPSVLLALPSFAPCGHPMNLMQTPLLIITKPCGWLCQPRLKWTLKIAAAGVFFLSLRVVVECSVYAEFQSSSLGLKKYFVDLFPAQLLLQRAFLRHLRAGLSVCGRGWTEGGTVFWAIRRAQAFTSRALILFFAELAQPLPVFGCA